MKQVKIGDLFTKKQLDDVKKYQNVADVEKNIVAPRMAHINAVTGQENDSKYFSYLLMHLGNLIKG
jgi:hypothetical protein